MKRQYNDKYNDSTELSRIRMSAIFITDETQNADFNLFNAKFLSGCNFCRLLYHISSTSSQSAPRQGVYVNLPAVYYMIEYDQNDTVLVNIRFRFGSRLGSG